MQISDKKYIIEVNLGKTARTLGTAAAIGMGLTKSNRVRQKKCQQYKKNKNINDITVELKDLGKICKDELNKKWYAPLPPDLNNLYMDGCTKVNVLRAAEKAAKKEKEEAEAKAKE